jgi:hypothetical protein
MAYPGRADWARLHAEGVAHVVCLTHDDPPYDPAPCTVSATRLQDLVDGRRPADERTESARVLAAAGVVVEHVRRGAGVAVHCMGGRGRTGAVLGMALVALGHDPDLVVSYLDRTARARGRRGWPESPWQAELVWGAATALAQSSTSMSTASPGAAPKNRALPNEYTDPSLPIT